MDLDKPVVAAAVEAVATTAHPLDALIVPDMMGAVRASMRDGIRPEHAAWWADAGQTRVVGWVIDQLQCDPEVALWASAAAMHARIVCGHGLIGPTVERSVADHALRAVVWWAGTHRVHPHHVQGDRP